MKQHRNILYAALAAGAMLLFAGLAFMWIPGGLKLIEESKPVDPYDALNGNIEKAYSIALKLKDFTWDEFDDIGLEAPPSEICKIGESVTTKELFNPNSGCKWISLPEMLPRPESAGTLILYCDMCSKMAERVGLEKPLDNSESPEWLELCSQLQSTLKGAIYSATKYKDTNEYVLTNLEGSIDNSDPALKKKYLEKFKNKSTKYLSSLEDMVNNLEEAEQALLQLTNGKLDSEPSPEENIELEIH